MAFTTILFKNPNTGQMKQAPVGFSWTVLFFGFFPPMIRGDWKWVIIMILAAVFTLGVSGLVFIFIYNKLYIKDLIGNGFKAESISNGDLKYAGAKIGMEIPQIEPT